MVVRLVMQQYRKELHVAKKLDEPRHWWRHPVRKAWRIEKIQRKIRESNQARFAQELVGFKCQFCGRDASAIPPSRRQFGLKYCSGECREKASIAAEKLRLESDPGLRQRKREYIKKCYHRTRRERPEVYRDRVRRKLADPLYRIAKSHRNRLNELIRKGLFRKTKSSLKYFGCTSAHLKQHLESKFKPGMTWENHGKVWHVDHIKALRGKGNFDLMNAADCACAFNWSNLQPLFAQANREKSNKVIDAPASLALVVT